MMDILGATKKTHETISLKDLLKIFLLSAVGPSPSGTTKMTVIAKVLNETQARARARLRADGSFNFDRNNAEGLLRARHKIHQNIAQLSFLHQPSFFRSTLFHAAIWATVTTSGHGVISFPKVGCIRVPLMCWAPRACPSSCSRICFVADS